MSDGSTGVPARLLLIGAKYPLPGLAKTRLARTLGEARALDLYRDFLLDLADRYRGATYAVCWLYTPAEAPFAALVGDGFGFLAQVGPNWTERQRHAFRWASEAGYRDVVVIGADAPQDPASVVEAAFAALEAHDVALQPTVDGGYQLLGVRGGHDVLDGVVMSTGEVAHNIQERCRRLGLSVALLPPTFDVDEEADLRLLRAALRGAPPHEARRTRAALLVLEDGQVSTTYGEPPCARS